LRIPDHRGNAPRPRGVLLRIKGLRHAAYSCATVLH